MKIQSLTDWNAMIVMCACCEMPEHPEPRTGFQSRGQYWPAAGWNIGNFQAVFGQALAPGFTAPAADGPISYRTATRQTTGTDMDPVTYTITAAAGAQYNIIGVPIPSTESGNTDPLQPYAGALIPVSNYAGGTYSGTLEANGETYQVALTFSAPVTFDSLLPIARSKLADLTWVTSGMVEAATEFTKTGYYDNGVYTEIDYPGGIRLTAIRYKVGVPSGYASSFYRIEWDEVLFPADPETPPSLVASRSWEYSGADEFSAWFEIEPPEIAGSIGLRNLRATSYRSPWGTKPQYFGLRWSPTG